MPNLIFNHSDEVVGSQELWILSGHNVDCVCGHIVQVYTDPQIVTLCTCGNGYQVSDDGTQILRIPVEQAQGLWDK